MDQHMMRGLKTFGGWVCLLLLFSWMAVPPAQAAQLTALVDSIEIVKESGGTGPFVSTDTMRIVVRWTAKSALYSGDSFAIRLPADMTGFTGSFPLTTDTGEMAGVCNVSSQQAVCTFNAYVQGRSGVGGTLRFDARLSSTRFDTTHTELLEFNASGHAFQVPVSLAQSGSYNPDPVVKWGYYNDASKTITWNVSIDRAHQRLDDVSIRDTIGPGQKILTNTIRVGYYQTSGRGDRVTSTLIPLSGSDYRILNANEQGFEVHFFIPLNANGENYNYDIVYEASLTDPNQTQWKNDVMLHSTQIADYSMSTTEIKYSGSGDIYGDETHYPETPYPVRVLSPTDPSSPSGYVPNAIYRYAENNEVPMPLTGVMSKLPLAMLAMTIAATGATLIFRSKR